MRKRRNSGVMSSVLVAPAPFEPYHEKDDKGRAIMTEVSRSYLLHNPESSNREYQGVLYFDGQSFESVTEWGKSGRCGSHSKTVYSGPSSEDACEAVNRMLRAKIKKGYIQSSAGDPYLRF